jgi:hypothetical protein
MGASVGRCARHHRGKAGGRQAAPGRGLRRGGGRGTRVHVDELAKLRNGGGSLIDHSETPMKVFKTTRVVLALAIGMIAGAHAATYQFSFSSQ